MLFERHIFLSISTILWRHRPGSYLSLSARALHPKSLLASVFTIVVLKRKIGRKCSAYSSVVCLWPVSLEVAALAPIVRSTTRRRRYFVRTCCSFDRGTKRTVVARPVGWRWGAPWTSRTTGRPSRTGWRQTSRSDRR